MMDDGVRCQRYFNLPIPIITTIILLSGAPNSIQINIMIDGAQAELTSMYG